MKEIDQPPTRIIFWLVIFCIYLFPAGAYAQSGSITGTVKDERGDPLPGVNVKENGTQNFTRTDASGKYQIVLKNAKSTLTFTFIGFAKQEQSVSGTRTLDVVLKEDASGLDEVVVVGYQDIERRKMTGAVSSVKGKTFENTPYATFDGMLQGRVAGLAVMSTSGEPGTNNIVNIRGSSNLRLADNYITAPLYVIDGIIYDVSDIQTAYGGASPLQAINPNDIESVDILKDASASAIYGARAANGVIIIKTKRPALGIPEIRVSAYTGVSDRPAMKPITTGAAERRLKMDLLYAGGPYNWFANNQISQMLTDSLNPSFNNNTDWQGLFLQKANINNVNASVGATMEKYTYRLSLQRYYEEGVMIGYENQSITPRLFLQMNPADNFQVETNLFAGFTKAKHGSGDNRKYPFDTWGFPSSFWQITDVEEAIYTGRYDDLMDDDLTTSWNGNVAGTIKKVGIPGLSFRSQFSFNMNNNTRDLFRPALLTGTRNQAQNWVNQNKRWEWESYFNYNKLIKEAHTVSGVLGFGAEKNRSNSTYLSGWSNNSEAIKTVNGIPSGADLSGYSTVSERSRLSVFGRLGYDYKNKYLLSASYRMDASSRYNPDNRWGIFPSISGGWALSEESFFEPLKNVISFFKIRSSYGLTGLDPGSYYARYTTLGFNADYFGYRLDNGLEGTQTNYNGTGVTYPNYVDPASSTSIKWEKTPQFNLGFDMNLFKDQVSITADYYIRDSKDMVFTSRAPITSGFSQISNNFIGIRNEGVELTINSVNMSPQAAFQWNTNFNITYNKNRVLSLPFGGQEYRTGQPWMERTLNVGQPLYPFQVWITDGVYATQADVPVDPLTGNRLYNGITGQYYKAGDPRQADLNGDYIIDYSDKVPMGNPNPNWTGGLTNSFSYKGFTASILFTFIFGRSLWNGYLSDRLQDAGSTAIYNTWGSNSAVSGDFDLSDFWLQSGDVARFPNLFSNTVENWHIAQSYFVENASFIRLKNIQLGYTLPQEWVKKLKLRSIRIYSMIDNVHVWSWSDTPDPEAVDASGYLTGNGYPIPKKYTFGLDVTF